MMTGVPTATEEDCEAAIPQELEKNGGGSNAHCIEYVAAHREGSKSVEGHFIGSQDPKMKEAHLTTDK
jgi:hypothetical protein